MLQPHLADEFRQLTGHALHNLGGVVDLRVVGIFRLAAHAPLQEDDLRRGKQHEHDRVERIGELHALAPQAIQHLGDVDELAYGFQVSESAPSIVYLRRGTAYGCGRSLSGLMNGPCGGMHLTYRDYGQFLSLAGCDERAGRRRYRG